MYWYVHIVMAPRLPRCNRLNIAIVEGPVNSVIHGGQVVGLPKHAYGLRFSQLSKGEQFRVELARCLVSGAVVDEFTSNTDR
jgi:ABC-type phosphate/phosphonate transport system ATPase subunit